MTMGFAAIVVPLPTLATGDAFIITLSVGSLGFAAALSVMIHKFRR